MTESFKSEEVRASNVNPESGESMVVRLALSESVSEVTGFFTASATKACNRFRASVHRLDMIPNV